MKQETRKSYWFLPIVIILLFVLAGCVRPAPQPDVTETPVPIPTTAEIPITVSSTPTPLPVEPYPGETAPPTEGETDPGSGNEEVVETEPPAVPPGQATTHTVQVGDTLDSLSQQYGVSQEEIAAANNITASGELTSGQTLVIPAPGTTTTPPETQPPDQLVPGEKVHIVQPGENLFRISLRYGKTVDEVAAYNGIANPHYIYPGQVIRIP